MTKQLSDSAFTLPKPCRHIRIWKDMHSEGTGKSHPGRLGTWNHEEHLKDSSSPTDNGSRNQTLGDLVSWTCCMTMDKSLHFSVLSFSYYEKEANWKYRKTFFFFLLLCPWCPSEGRRGESYFPYYLDKCPGVTPTAPQVFSPLPPYQYLRWLP